MPSRFICVQLFAMLWTLWTAHQAPLSMGFCRQEYWSGLPCPSPRDLHDPEIEPMTPEVPALQADSLPLNHLGKPIYAHIIEIYLHGFINYVCFVFIFETFIYNPHMTPALFPILCSQEAHQAGHCLGGFAVTVICT